MKVDFTTRLSSGQTQTQLNATVLASLNELLAAINSGSKPDKVNLHPHARLYKSQLGTMDGDRFARETDGFGIPTEAFKDGAVTDAAIPTASISHRAFATKRGYPGGVRGMLLGPKTGILHGYPFCSIANGASSGTCTLDWDTGSYPYIYTLRPAVWSTPLSNIQVIWCPSESWVRGASPTCRIAVGKVNSVSDTGFVLQVDDYLWPPGGPSSPYTVGNRTFAFYWLATFKHS